MRPDRIGWHSGTYQPCGRARLFLDGGAPASSRQRSRIAVKAEPPRQTDGRTVTSFCEVTFLRCPACLRRRGRRAKNSRHGKHARPPRRDTATLAGAFSEEQEPDQRVL